MTGAKNAHVTLQYHSGLFPSMKCISSQMLDKPAKQSKAKFIIHVFWDVTLCR